MRIRILLLLALTAGTAWAQAPATDPAAPTAPLRHEKLTASGTAATQEADWRAANQAVAQFPRGHADILKWEARQRGDQKPPEGHPHHGGH
ncbi:MAG: hypothetical protein QM740_00850 [Acidovorax sp.]